MKILKWGLGVVLAAILACVLAFVVWAWPVLRVPPVRDFTLADVQVVERADFRPCTQPSISCLPSLPYDRLLRIRLTTDRNLVEHAVAHELNVWHDAWSCSNPPDRYAAGEFLAPGVHVDQEPFPYGTRRNADEFYAAIGRGAKDPLVYEIYLVPRWDQTKNAYEAGKERAPPYDIADGRDVCLRIGGGNMLGGRFVGNTVRVSSARIRAALAAERAPAASGETKMSDGL